MYGGGFNNGFGSDLLYDGSVLCCRGDVVVVIFNYWLNIFGYLYLGVFGDVCYVVLGNVGQFDLVQVLQWVCEYVVIFGGDVGNIIVFGQFGGGVKIVMLMVMFVVCGLFQCVWIMSGQQVIVVGLCVVVQCVVIVMEVVGVKDLFVLLWFLVVDLFVVICVCDLLWVESILLYFGLVLDEVFFLVYLFWLQVSWQLVSILMVIGNMCDEICVFFGNDLVNFILIWEMLLVQL